MMAAKQIRKMNIMLAVDGSEHSWAAARLLCDLPLTKDSLVTALAALVPRDASSHAALETALEQTQAFLKEKGIPVSTELLTGYPGEALGEYADQYKPDLIMLGAKGLRATLGILLGGVVQQIVEYVNWPVLVVRAPYVALQRVLLITDSSVYSQRALEYLASFPLPAEAEVRVLHVLPPLPLPSIIARTWPIGTEAVPPLPSYEVEAALSKQAEEEEREGRALLEQVLKRLESYGMKATAVLLRGDDASEIIEYVKANQVNLIVAGSRGLSPMKRLLLGSLSRKLVHYAGCSVMIVKGGDHAHD